MRINLTIEEKLLKEFDIFCQTYHYDRSELIRELMRKNIYPNLVLFPLKIEVPKNSTTPVKNTEVKTSTPIVENKTSTMPIENNKVEDGYYLDDYGMVHKKKYNRVPDIEKLKQLTNV